MARKAPSPAVPTIVAQAPCRADLAGGTIDLWPLYLFHPGAMTLNFALEILTTCRITPLEGRQIELCSLDTDRKETYDSIEDLVGTSQHLHVLAAYVVRFSPRNAAFVWKPIRSRRPEPAF